jgi:hypothetical protein
VIFKQAYLSAFINTVLPLWGKRIKFKKTNKGDKINLLTAVFTNCRLKYFVTLVTYCYNNVLGYFNQQLSLTGVGEYGPK